ncbi:MAG: metallophosphoesterase [Myxococcales bacterium]|nr:metallophosphoesterase [Myxococcales bacterium]
MPRTLFIGDVHGCLDELQDLLAACGWSRQDQVVLVGDLTAKGPDSQGVVQLARERGFSAVLGNHDDHVLHMRDKDPREAKREHHAHVAASLRPEDLRWLADLPLTLTFDLDGGSYLAVHGGLVPGVPLQAQSRKELLNLRSLRADGSPSRRIEGTPWGAMWPGPAHAVYGHDAVRGLQQHPFATGLDTGCVYGNRLTALMVPGRVIKAVPARRVYSRIER